MRASVFSAGLESDGIVLGTRCVDCLDQGKSVYHSPAPTAHRYHQHKYDIYNRSHAESQPEQDLSSVSDYEQSIQN